MAQNKTAKASGVSKKKPAVKQAASKSVSGKNTVPAAKGKTLKTKPVSGKSVKSVSSAKSSAELPVLKYENIRKAYGEALAEAGKTNPDIVVLEADLRKSTMSIMFRDAFPDRFFEMGIAEQNMTSAAAGFALAGKIPFTGTFAVFAAGRAYDQIRCSIAIPEANVKLVGSSTGLSDFGDGRTHQSVEDGNIIRAMPNMVVLNPADAVEMRKMIPAVIKHKGPVYIRISRNDLPVFTPPGGEYKIGKMYPVTEGKDAVIFATGVMVSKAFEAAEKLKSMKISVQVVNVSTLKPLDKKEVLKYAAGKKAVIVAEEAVRTGGLGQAIISVLAGEVKAKFGIVAIDDEFGTSAASYEELLVKFGLSSGHVYKAVLAALRK